MTTKSLSSNQSLPLFPIHMFRDNSALTISPAVPEILQALTFVETTLGQKGSKREAIRLFTELASGALGPTVMTYHGLWRRVKKVAEEAGYQVVMHDKREVLARPQFKNMFGFRGSQMALTVSGLMQEESGCIGAPTRYGKCFGRGTPVMMADGSVLPVELVVEGDYVMGPDSKPRKVAGCTRGESEMFRVTPNYNGMVWTCNADHILHVQRVCEDSREGRSLAAGSTENITVTEWNKAAKWFRHVRKMKRVAVDFNEKNLPMPPYIYGLWLGDGHSSGVSFTNMEPEVWAEIEKWALTEGLIEAPRSVEAGRAVTRHWVKNLGHGVTKRDGNPVRGWFRKFLKSKGIRAEFLTASRQQRLELLAGLLDTDGESSSTTNCDFISKHKKLAEDVAFMCNTLGFGAVVKLSMKKAQSGPKRAYWRVGIRGETDLIPFRVERKKRVRKNKFNALTVGFKVEPIGHGEYFGFALEDPEGLFLLGDCTVVHNTIIMINTARAFPTLPTVVCAPGIDLVRQLYTDFKSALLDRTVTWVKNAKSKQGDLVVCSLDSLHHCNHGLTRLLLLDEPHATAADTRIPQVKNFTMARKIGYGATLTGRFDRRNIVIEGLIGPTLVNKTYREAVAEKMICPIVVIQCVIKFDPWNVLDRNCVMRHLLWESKRTANVFKIISDTLPREWQTLIFIKNEKQAVFYHDALKDAAIPVAMAKLLTAKARKELTEEVRIASVTRCLCSDIYVQGVTFSNIRALINGSGGGPYTSAIQKPGRLAEIRPELNKKRGLLFDVTFEPSFLPSKDAMPNQGWWSIVREGEARMKVYREIGYDIVTVTAVNQLKSIINELVNE